MSLWPIGTMSSRAMDHVDANWKADSVGYRGNRPRE